MAHILQLAWCWRRPAIHALNLMAFLGKKQNKKNRLGRGAEQPRQEIGLDGRERGLASAS